MKIQNLDDTIAKILKAISNGWRYVYLTKNGEVLYGSGNEEDLCVYDPENWEDSYGDVDWSDSEVNETTPKLWTDSDREEVANALRWYITEFLAREKNIIELTTNMILSDQEFGQSLTDRPTPSELGQALVRANKYQLRALPGGRKTANSRKVAKKLLEKLGK